MRCRYREKKYYCAQYLEVDIYPLRYQPKGKRGKKWGTTPESQKALNNLNRVKKLTRLLNTNFTENDLVLTLTYDPSKNPASEEEAEKNLRNFFRRLKRCRKKNGLSELKYVVATEKGSRKGRWHHHMIISGGMLDSEIQKVWGNGYIRASPIHLNEQGLKGLAKYITKKIESEEIEENQKAWHASRNLIQPRERTNDSKISGKKAKELYDNQECREIFEKLYPDYEFVDCSPFYNEVDGGYYLTINLYKKQIHTSGRKSKQKGKKK